MTALDRDRAEVASTALIRHNKEDDLRHLPPHKANGETRQRSRKSVKTWLPAQDTRELFWLGVVLLNLVPAILLAALASTLSKPLGSTACLPNGQFVFPGTASIWDRRFFFNINIVAGRYRYSSLTFAEVKTIDVVWDTVVGRGGQILLVYLSYRIFNQALVYVMDTQSVSYESYGAVAFESGSVQSLWRYLRAMRKPKVGSILSGDVNGRRRRIFGAMIVTTAYVVAMPTLYSAMTGYAPVLEPSVSLPSDGSGVQSIPCGTRESYGSFGPGGFNAVWGVCFDCRRVQLANNYGIASFVTKEPLRLYYERHAVDYEAAQRDPACTNRTSPDCTPLAKPSTLYYNGYHSNISSPLLDIRSANYDPVTGKSDRWMCGSGLYVFKSSQFFPSSSSQFLDGNFVTGNCGAPNPTFQWGFSFLPLLIVCILQSIWAAVMYALWVEARRGSVDKHRRDRNADNAATRPSYLVSAVALVSQAELLYGDGIKTWTSRELDQVVWRGSKGMGGTKE